MIETNADDKRKHLELIQGVINRMASNSFLFKGWSITIIAAISAYAAKDANPALMIVPIVTTVLFWSVDAYYLMLERAFRALYSTVATKPVAEIDYSLTVDRNQIKITSWLKTLITRPMLYLFYISVLMMLILLTLILNNISGIKMEVIYGS